MRPIRLPFLIVLIVCVVSCVTTPRACNDRVTVFINATIIDGTGARAVADGLLAVRGDTIVWVGSREDAPRFSRARVIDAEGSSLLPGFVNAHIHEIADLEAREKFAAGGVTGLGLTGAPWSDILRILSDDSCVAARVYWCGPMITYPGGFPGIRLDPALGLTVATEDAARNAVAEISERGAWFIKIALEQGSPIRRPGSELRILSPDQIRAISDAAHARGLTVRAHCTDLDAARLAVRGGVDVIDHIPRPAIAPEDLRLIQDHPDPVRFVFTEYSPEYAEVMRQIAGAGIVLVPTITSAAFAADATSAGDVERIGLAILLRAVTVFRDAGGTIAIGNDYPETGAEIGIPIFEMSILAKAGFTPMELIRAATLNSALACGAANEVGTLEAGKRADLILVRGDPLTDMSVLAHPQIIMTGGTILAP